MHHYHHTQVSRCWFQPCYNYNHHLKRSKKRWKNQFFFLVFTIVEACSQSWSWKQGCQNNGQAEKSCVHLEDLSNSKTSMPNQVDKKPLTCLKNFNQCFIERKTRPHKFNQELMEWNDWQIPLDVKLIIFVRFQCSVALYFKIFCRLWSSKMWMNGMNQYTNFNKC